MSDASIKKVRNFSESLVLIRKIFARADISRWSFLLPGVVAAVASLCEGLSLLLLIPTIKLIIGHGNSEAEKAALAEVPLRVRELLPSDPSTLIGCFLMLTFGSAMTKIVLNYGASLVTVYHIKRFANKLRILIYERYLSFGKQFFDQNSLGFQSQILTTYVNGISLSLGTVQSTLYSFCTILVYVAMMFAISVKLTLAVLLVFPVLHVALRSLISRIEKTSRAYVGSYNELGRKITNALSCVPLVKAYCAEEIERTAFAHLSDQVAAFEFSIEKKNLLISPVQEALLLLFLMIFVIMLALLGDGRDPAHFASYVVYVLVLKRAATVFGVFNVIRSSLATVAGPVGEVLDVFSDQGKYFIPDGPQEFKSLSKAIQFKDLSFSFPNERSALSNVSFSIPKGTCTAIVGKSGSGKSTIINLLMRFYDVAADQIFVDDTDIRAFSLASWRAQVALVSQDSFLFNATLRSNLLYGLSRQVPLEELEFALKRARLSEFVAKLPKGLETEIGDRGVQLSGGERQRVSIARAILKGAEILLLDEATSALDSETERLIQEALSDLVQGKTTVMVAHRLATVRQAEQIVVLENGRVVEHGRPDELLSRGGRFAAYWKEQSLQS